MRIAITIIYCRCCINRWWKRRREFWWILFALLHGNVIHLWVISLIYFMLRILWSIFTFDFFHDIASHLRKHTYTSYTLARCIITEIRSVYYQQLFSSEGRFVCLKVKTSNRVYLTDKFFVCRLYIYNFYILRLTDYLVSRSLFKNEYSFIGKRSNI